MKLTYILWPLEKILSTNPSIINKQTTVSRPFLNQYTERQLIYTERQLIYVVRLTTDHASILVYIILVNNFDKQL